MISRVTKLFRNKTFGQFKLDEAWYILAEYSKNIYQNKVSGGKCIGQII